MHATGGLSACAAAASAADCHSGSYFNRANRLNTDPAGQKVQGDPEGDTSAGLALPELGRCRPTETECARINQAAVAFIAAVQSLHVQYQDHDRQSCLFDL